MQIENMVAIYLKLKIWSACQSQACCMHSQIVINFSNTIMVLFPIQGQDNKSYIEFFGLNNDHNVQH